MSKATNMGLVIGFLALALCSTAQAQGDQCSVSKRAAAYLSESLFATNDMVSPANFNIFQAPSRPPKPGEIEVRVATRQCRGSAATEFETWVIPKVHKEGASEWVPLVELRQSAGEPSLWTVLGDRAAPRRPGTPDVRLVRQYFPVNRIGEVQAGKVGGIHVRGFEAKWMQIRKGEHVTLSDGGSVPVSEHLIGAEISLTLANVTTRTASYPDAFFLAAADGQPISKLYACDRCADLTAGEVRSVSFLQSMTPLRDGQLYLVNVRTGLRLQLPAVP